MGSKGGTTQQTSTQSSSGPPPQVLAEYQGLVDRATNVANQPYQPYQGEQVAPLASQTLQGLGQIGQYANAAQLPLFGASAGTSQAMQSATDEALGSAGAASGMTGNVANAAMGMTEAAAAPVNAQQFQGQSSLQPFMNPYTSDVVQATQNEFNNQNQQQAQFLNSANISSGAFGGDRAGVSQGILANQQQLAEAPTIAGLNQANFTQAMQDWQQQQGVNLGAAQANRSALMGAANQYGNLGLTAANQIGNLGLNAAQEVGNVGLAGSNQMGQIGLSEQQAGLQGGQAQIQAGTIPQTEQQAIDTAAQNMYQTGQSYPFTTTGWLGNIIEGTGSLSGGQGSSTTTSPGPNAITQGLGAASQGVGLLGSIMSLSDERAKENIEPIGETYDNQKIYRYNFKGDPRTQIGLLAQEEAYHHPGSVQRIGMGDLLGIDYGGATEDAADRGHFASGGAPPASMAGLGAMGGMGGGGAMSPGSDLMFSGDPGARMGMGTFALMGGSNVRPEPTTAMSRPPGWEPPYQPAPQAPPPQQNLPQSSFRQLQQYGLSGGEARPSFQGGGTAITTPEEAIPIGTSGQSSYTQGWQPGDLLNPAAGVSEALFGEATAGSKTPYYGLDLDQLNAIGGGQWMPPDTNAPQPDYGNLQNSPQFGAAEKSLSGLFGPGYTPGSTGAPPATSPVAAAAAKPAAQQQPAGHWQSVGGTTTGGAAGGENLGMGAQIGNVFQNEWVPDPAVSTVAATAAPGLATGKADGGGVSMRSGFQRGGFPQFTTYQPTANPARTPPTYTALDLSHMFGGGQQPQQAPRAIQIQRQLGQARAQAAAQRGIVRPRVIAPDPVTGQHHDITPPDHPSTARYPGWPTPGPGNATPDGLPMRPPARVPLQTSPNAFPGGVANPTIPSSRGGGMGFPSLGMVPAAAAGTPPGPLASASWWGGLPKEELPSRSRGLTTVAPPLDGTQEWNKPSAEVESPRESAEFSEAGRPLMAPRLIGADPGGQHTLLGPHSMQALPPPSGDEAPMHSGWDVDLPGVFRGGGHGIAAEARGGRVPRYYGGRIGRDDGGSIPIGGGAGNVMEAPTGTPASPDLSDIDWNSIFGGDPGQGAVRTPDFSALPDDTFDLGGGSPQRAQIDPRAVAQAPSFQGASGGGGGGPHFTQVSNMGGPPISALDLSGHYTPTTGNARGATYVPGAGGAAGAGISPNARAEAPEHPAIAVARHIASRAHAAGFAAGHAAGRGASGRIIPTQMGPEGVASPRPYGPQLSTNPTQMGPEGVANYQGGGGVMGSSPVMNAGAYTPQGEGVTGQTSQGRGMGFGDLFGGGDRAGFQTGGEAGVDPFLAAIDAAVTQGPRGQGPPQAPQAPKPPEPPGQGQQPGGDLGKNIQSLTSGIKGLGGQSQGGGGGGDGSSGLTGGDPSDLSGGWGDMAGTPNMDDASLGLSMGDDFGFAMGGGVGLGSLRGGFSDGGTPDLDALDAEVAGAPPPGQVAAAPATGAGKGGGGGNVSDLINQNFGNRAGYASTISSLESSMGKNYVGDGGSSFGPYMLHYGGVSQKYPHPGLGDEFTKQTGLDARDPSTVPQQIKFVADYTAAHGWHDWSTKAQADKLTGGAPTAVAGADVPSAAAQPAQASTEAYGGGFQIPPGQGSPPPGQLNRANLQAPTMGDEIRHDPFGYMMTVGAGMMASRSPWLGVGIGEGFEAGNKYLQSQKELEKSWGQTQAQINNLSQEARDHGADADLKAQQLQTASLMNKLMIERMRQKGLIPGGTSGAPSPAPTGGPGQGLQPTQPLTTLGGGSGSSGAPSGPSAPSGGAAAPSGPAPADPDAAPRIEDDPLYKQAQDLYTKAQDAELDDRLMGTHTAEDMRAQAKELSDAAQKNFEKTSAPYGAKIEAQKAGFTEYQKRADEFTGDYQSNVEMLQQLGKIYQHYRSGTGAGDIGEIQGFADRFGLGGVLPQGWDKAGYDAAMKTAVDAAFQKMQSSGANKAPRSIMQEALTTSPTPTNDPAANWKIITETLARLKYSKEMMDSVMGSGSLNVTKAENAWMKTHASLDPYRSEARKNTPVFMGMTPDTYAQVTGAKLEKAKDGRVFDRESGKVWDAKGNPLN
jgi:hypothetical protein